MYDRIQALPGASFGARLKMAAELGMRSPELVRELMTPGWRERNARLVFVDEVGVVQVEGDEGEKSSA